MKLVKDHFEEEAREFDELIVKLIPDYKGMVDSLIRSIPFESSKPIEVLDIGCGTGNITRKVKKRYPNAQVTCIDIAENMIDIAQYKMSEFKDIKYQVVDLRDFQFGEDSYDLVISSLVLHHLQADEDKIGIYQKIYDSLHEGGVFLNADHVLASSEYREQVNLDEWKNFMLKSLSLDEVEEKWMPTYFREDHPALLLDQLDWLREIGFKEVDVVWKLVKGAVFSGTK